MSMSNLDYLKKLQAHLVVVGQSETTKIIPLFSPDIQETIKQKLKGAFEEKYPTILLFPPNPSPAHMHPLLSPRCKLDCSIVPAKCAFSSSKPSSSSQQPTPKRKAENEALKEEGAEKKGRGGGVEYELPVPKEVKNKISPKQKIYYVFCHGELNFHEYPKNWVQKTPWVNNCITTDYFYQPTDFAKHAADIIDMDKDRLSIMTGAVGTEQLSEKSDNKILSMSKDLLCRTPSTCLIPELVGSVGEEKMMLLDDQERFVRSFYCPPNNMGVNKECKFGDNCTCDSLGRHNNKTCSAHAKETWRMGIFCDKGKGDFDISELKKNPKNLVTSCGKWENRSLRAKCNRIWNWERVEKAIGELNPGFNLVDYITTGRDNANIKDYRNDTESPYPGNSRPLKICLDTSVPPCPPASPNICTGKPINRMKDKERLWNKLYNWVKFMKDDEELLQNIRFCKLFYLRLIHKPDSDPENRHISEKIYLNTDADANNKTLKFDVEGIFGAELMEIYGPGVYVYVNCSPLRIWEGTEYPLRIETQKYKNNFIKYNTYVLDLNQNMEDAY